MTDEIKALPSLYKGITFRSRTEARWAVFFENLGLTWEHEREGFDINGKWYLPDFHLPEFPLWFEVKPDETDEDLAHFAELCRLTAKPGIIAFGPPKAARTNLLYFNKAGVAADGRFAFLADRRDEAIYWLGRQDRGFALGGPGVETDHPREPIVSERLKAAFEAAGDAKFGT